MSNNFRALNNINNFLTTADSIAAGNTNNLHRDVEQFNTNKDMTSILRVLATTNGIDSRKELMKNVQDNRYLNSYIEFLKSKNFITEDPQNHMLQITESGFEFLNK